MSCWENYDPDYEGTQWCGHLNPGPEITTWSSNGCPRDNLLAACATEHDLRARYYYEGEVDLDVALGACESMDGWLVEP
jgi:hypothetical protein